MIKILYDFDNINISLENLTKNLDLLGNLSDNVNKLSLNIADLEDSLNKAKKSTFENISNVEDVLERNLKKMKYICDSYQEYEKNKIGDIEILNDKIKANLYTNYKIKRGDTLNSIAERYNITVEQIMAANKDKIKDADIINAGDTIILPGVSSGGVATSIIAGASIIKTGASISDIFVSKDSNNTLNNESNKNAGISDSQDNVHKTTKKSESNVVGTTMEKTEEKTSSTTVTVSNTEYKSNSVLGFNVTYDNKTYSLSAADKDLLYAIVAAESDKSPDDALAVITTILNRCETPAWINSHGTSPVSQATARNQFVVYQSGKYLSYTNGKAPAAVKKAVDDALNGVRNHSYLSFKANSVTSVGSNMISSTGNRYHNAMV